MDMNLSYTDIMPGLVCYRSRLVSKTPIKDGRFHKEYEGVEEIDTPIGKIKKKEWTQLAVEIIRREGDGSLLDAIEEYVKENCLWVNDSERLYYAASCLLCGSYKH